MPQAIEWLAKQGSLPGPSQDNLEIFVAGSRREMAQVINRERSGKRGMTLVFRHPETAHQANEEIEWLDGRPTVISGEIRPVLLLDALNQSMRDLAARRERQTEYLSAWGAEMIRVHLNNAEQNALDTRRNREEILRLTGGIPTLIMSLIGQMINVGAEEAFVSWRQDDRLARSLEGTTIERALKEILEVDTPEDYRDVEELVKLASGKDLTSIGPDLQAIGLIAGWNPQKHRVRLSALGELVSRQAKTALSVSA